MKENKNLNVFTMCLYSPWRYPSNWWRNIKQFFRHFRWAWQRITKGFCDYDCFDLDQYYLALLPVTLRHLADNTHGYPEGMTYEDWQAKIRLMAEKIEAAAAIDPIMDTAATDFKGIEEKQKERDKLIHEGFKLVADNLWHLWD